MKAWWFLVLFFTVSSHAQKHLILLKHGKVVGRFPESSYIYLILKDGRKKEGRIVELLEFAMMLSSDTVPFNKIKKVGIPKEERRGISPLFGSFLLVGGVVYFGIDQINSALGYNPPGVDQQVVKISAIMIAIGAPLVFIRPAYRRVNTDTFLRTIDYKSPFYNSG